MHLQLEFSIKVKLDYNFDIDIWNEGVFGIGNSTLDDLLNKLNEADFGIFVFTPDDKSIIRKENLSTVRDNVLYELGLYTGKLGRNKTFIITPSELPTDFHLPTDLIGINLGTYDSNKILSNPESAVSVFCTKIKNQIFNTPKYIFNGKWVFTWEIQDSKNYSNPISEEVDVFHYDNFIKFIHTISTNEKYIVKGEFSKKYLTGTFSEISNIGYDGTFQMTLNGKTNSFEGLYIGWQNNGQIGSGPCTLKRKN